MQVHKSLGPGLLESAYEACLCHELTLAKLPFERQVAVPLRYRDVDLECGFRLDLLVRGKAVVEIKAVEHLLPIHEAQLLTYLRISRRPLGLLINFNVIQLRHGIRRFVF